MGRLSIREKPVNKNLKRIRKGIFYNFESEFAVE
jgi:hypothetical protein